MIPNDQTSILCGIMLEVVEEEEGSRGHLELGHLPSQVTTMCEGALLSLQVAGCHVQSTLQEMLIVSILYNDNKQKEK